MKRQKRNHTSRAFTRGYLAGVEGRSRSLCPHSTGEIKQSWLTGWREGREDHWNGFNTLAQVQRVSNIS